jgi:nitrogen regulatory protein P-II 1
MKLVIAYIHPEKLADVRRRLYARAIYKFSVSSAMGRGEEEGYHETYRGVDVEVDLLRRVRLEIAVNEAFVQPAIDAIVEGARGGKIGDGKIFVVDLAQCIRIRTGETGGHAIG